MAGIVEDLVDGARLHDAARVHHVHEVRNLGHHAQVMGDVDNADAALRLDAFDQLQDLGLDGHVQRGGGLVADEHIRVTGQGDGDDHALAHAAAELVGILAHPLFRLLNAHLGEQTHGLVPGLLLGGLVMPDHALHDLLADGHGGVQAGHGVLEDHRDPLAVDVAADVAGFHFQNVHGGGGAVVVAVVVYDAAAVHHTVGGQDTHGRLEGDGLAAAALAHHRQGGAPGQVNVHAADGVHRACAGLEGDGQIPNGQYGFLCIVFHGLSPHISFSLGSKASRRPSASMLKQSISSDITTMGGTIW